MVRRWATVREPTNKADTIKIRNRGIWLGFATNESTGAGAVVESECRKDGS